MPRSPLHLLAVRVRRRSLADLLLLARAGLLLVVLRVVLVVLGFRRACGLVRRWSDARGRRRFDPGRTDSVVWAVWSASGRIPNGRNCLLRSLAVHVLLGSRSELRIGVRSDTPDGFAAHAWVEVDGEVVTREPAGVEGWAVFEDCVVRRSREETGVAAVRN